MSPLQKTPGVLRRRRSLGSFSPVLSTLLIALIVGAVPGAIQAGEHVRVVLDVSKSMRQKDPHRLAPLSTMLLYDLADPDLTLGDSFEILPFHPTQKWHDPADSPPTEIGRRIRPVHGDRERLVDTLTTIPYDADWTYFYPGLRLAASELAATPGGASDVRVAVVVTDGVPEKDTRDEELRRIRSELQPILERQGIHLYILAFGPEASSQRDFFEALVKGPGGASLGRVFLDPTGDGLPGHMIDLFGHAFGYTQEPPRPTSPAPPLDLEGGHTPDRSAVVVYSPKPQIPSLSLAAPHGAPRAPTSPVGVVGAAVRSPKDRRRGAAFALQWVLSPHQGLHSLSTDAGSGGQVAVLRPTRLRLEIRPRAGATAPAAQSRRAMARTPFPLQVLMRPPGGAQGDPGEAQIAFTAHGPRRGLDPATGGGLYAWSGKTGAPPAGPASLVAEGRLYPIEPVFEHDPEPDEDFYVGYLEVEARRGAARVGELRGTTAHRVEVYPRLYIVPTPSLGDAVADGEGAARALRQGEKACVDFTPVIDIGRMPHPDRPVYGWRARLGLDPSKPKPESLAALSGASFTLDGLPLELVGGRQDRDVMPAPPEWSTGRTLDLDAWLDTHRLCVRLGRPSQAEESTLRLPLELTLLESPYDDFEVVEPFVLKLSVARPGLLDRRAWLYVPMLILLLTGAALWYLRDRPDLPADLRISIARLGSSAVPGSLPRGPLWRRLLGLVEMRLVLSPQGTALARLQPTRAELYRLKPGRGVRIESGHPTDPTSTASAAVPADGSTLDIEAGSTYRLLSGDGAFEIRLDYGP